MVISRSTESPDLLNVLIFGLSFSYLQEYMGVVLQLLTSGMV
jgi:hypothetical protein